MSLAECRLPSWLCHMLLVKEPAPGEQYGRMAAGNTHTAVLQNKTEEEYESHHRAAEAARETTNQPGTNNERMRTISIENDPQAE